MPSEAGDEVAMEALNYSTGLTGVNIAHDNISRSVPGPDPLSRFLSSYLFFWQLYPLVYYGLHLPYHHSRTACAPRQCSSKACREHDQHHTKSAKLLVKRPNKLVAVAQEASHIRPSSQETAQPRDTTVECHQRWKSAVQAAYVDIGDIPPQQYRLLRVVGLRACQPD